MSKSRRETSYHKGYKSHAFTPAEDARILELRAKGLNRAEVGRTMDISYCAVSIRITLLETLASDPRAKVRICIRTGCTTEFVSLYAGHRVCQGCRGSEQSCEPFGNFIVVNA